MLNSKLLPLLLLCLLMQACRKPLNEIPARCYELETASFEVNGQAQTTREGGLFQGVNLNEQFSIKANGEWSLSLDSDAYEWSLSAQALFEQSSFATWTEAQWLNALAALQPLDLGPQNPWVQQLFFKDLSTQRLYLKEDVQRGQAILSHHRRDQACDYLELIYEIDFQDFRVKGRIYVSVERKIPQNG